jgi:hypothetical protein
MASGNLGNKGGSGSHKTKTRVAGIGSFALKSTLRRKISNADAIAMHGNIFSMVDGFTAGERRLLRYLLVGIARQVTGQEITELKEIVLDTSYKTHLYQVLYKPMPISETHTYFYFRTFFWLFHFYSLSLGLECSSGSARKGRQNVVDGEYAKLASSTKIRG